MRKFIDAATGKPLTESNLLRELDLREGEVVSFPGNPRPTNHMAIARGGAEVRGFPEKVPLDAFTKAYIEAALWSSVDDEGEPLDNDHDAEDIASPTLKRMAKDCADFQQANARALAEAYEAGAPAYNEEQAGHDFWLTRNRHGAGFWDRGLGQIGKTLTDTAHAYGECDLYIGDDGMIHA